MSQAKYRRKVRNFMRSLFGEAQRYERAGMLDRAEDCRNHAMTLTIYGTIYETPSGQMTRQELRAILSEAQNHRCCYCGVRMTEPPMTRAAGECFFETDASIEHVVPTSQGGDHSWDNTAACCFACNNRRPSNVPALVYFERRVEILRLRSMRAAKAKKKRYRKKPKPPFVVIEIKGGIRVQI